MPVEGRAVVMPALFLSPPRHPALKPVCIYIDVCTNHYFIETMASQNNIILSSSLVCAELLHESRLHFASSVVTSSVFQVQFSISKSYSPIVLRWSPLLSVNIVSRDNLLSTDTIQSSKCSCSVK